MRRPGNYGDSSGNAFGAAQMQQHMSGQRMEHRSSHYQGRPESMNSEKEHHPYGGSKVEGQWRWERDGSSSHMFNEGRCSSFYCTATIFYLSFGTDIICLMEYNVPPV